MKHKTEALFEESYFQDIYQSDYDRRNPRYKHRSYLSEVRRVAKNGGLLLDVGCAYGSFLREAAPHFTAHGCDVSAHAVEVAQKRVPSAQIFQSDLLGIETMTRYDVITCFDVLEHIPAIDQALIHLHKLLKPGGSLIITMPVYDTVVGKLVGYLDRDPTHVHKISRYEWLALLSAAGFHQLSWNGIVRYYFGGPFYLHYCSRVLRRCSPAILITSLANS